MAHEKGYLSRDRFAELDDAYDHCGRMLERLHQSLSAWRGSTRTGMEVREGQPAYQVTRSPSDWDHVLEITEQIDTECL